ncbi:Histone-lysine N-methyltransferase MEDEA [Arabidopsis thaliana]|uniref:Histone-lysine N-methyltransferase MEDEA n=4 Tax=Arabidopsis TaxID=3701 RepID=MEDEA_ARATH|nr:SET domain-containing protein [Arabidopsis thaliana]O65312.1 RecName: Full=Histone-lysine N-methyltransferase MEDEA; AltName: Full=Maternal embryogenesis control protein; AltName: Full=Protein EMBRYO DEFECTIVE 173; AltName: Full=Protein FERTILIZATION-INDEPENDENT SEED 1; AltName: Full=Protein SET DOMAIN GROUP 5 [Arabidopsis thaliana]AAC39446.1 MEDEA [Arabidopsis thaliana]AAD09103.1 fertilization-independent seed 1 protein [Arabidopsis thaliana]AAG10636.1 SET domain protein of the Polycomb-gro|eukprot:NP_563658.1 SET domain-containing protein [Arabidopsis thaliana]
MEKENHEDDGEGLPPELNQIKEQIEKERFLHIKRKFELRYIPSVATHASHHQSFDLNQPAAEDDNGGDNKSLLSRMQNPLRHFSASSDYNSYEDQGYVLDEDQDYALEEDVPLFLDEDVPLLPSVKLPIVEKLPRSITWVFTKSSQLMAESDSVIGKRQIYYLNGEALELSSEEDEEDEEEDEEEIKKEKCEFSEDVDRFIWTVGQDYGLDDLVVRRALAKYLEVDVSDILERYNELKLKNDGTAGEASDLTSKTITTAFQDFADRRHCRRCMIFDCHMHEKYEPESRSSEDKSSLFEDEDRQPCSEHCYLKVRSVTEADHVMDNDNSISNKIVVSDPNNTMWTPVEKDLYLKGIEIFGRNSCDVALNILRGLKTCLEIYNYMREQDQCTMSLDLNKTTQRHNQVTKKVSRKSSRSVRKKSRLRKYARYPPALKKTTSGEAKFYKHYTPCTCKSKCGQQCPCLTHENCCEKYCGCSKDCNNRFGGCNCAIGQCTNRQCPCFAANRECDPDLCRSCPLSCGDGTLGETPVQIQCKNMQFLLQTNKKILIGKSDVHGWGAFTWDSLKKNEYLGEYTGELITHDEANERGRIEDRIGSSYLFTLNDQLEIDARRKGNEFKFLNHSARPNCYAKLMIVRGDQRIGLFAERAIEEGEELFFDYCYGPEHADWSRGREPRKTGASKRSKEARPAR